MCYQKDDLYMFAGEHVKITTTDNYESEADSGSGEEELFITTDDGKLPLLGRSRIADIELA